MIELLQTLSMKTFIKVIEIWVPDKSRTRLEFGSGLYGGLTEFKAASEKQGFGYNEGLPGKAWAQGRPIVLTSLVDSYFKRGAAARQAGLTSGIALPIFSGEFLLAVVLFLCGDDEDHAGAIELWRPDGNVLRVLDGYYGSLKHFESLSIGLTLANGHGIPGGAYQSRMPMLLEDIGSLPELIRSAEAQRAGITTVLGIPVRNRDGSMCVMTFLSAKATPIAKRIQIWIPDDQRERLLCLQGYSKDGNDLAEIFETLTVSKGEGALGRVWLTGMPLISGQQGDSDYHPELDNLSSMLAIPVIDEGRMKAIVTFLF